MSNKRKDRRKGFDTSIKASVLENKKRRKVSLVSIAEETTKKFNHGSTSQSTGELNVFKRSSIPKRDFLGIEDVAAQTLNEKLDGEELRFKRAEEGKRFIWSLFDGDRSSLLSNTKEEEEPDKEKEEKEYLDDGRVVERYKTMKDFIFTRTPPCSVFYDEQENLVHCICRSPYFSLNAIKYLLEEVGLPKLSTDCNGLSYLHIIAKHQNTDNIVSCLEYFSKFMPVDQRLGGLTIVDCYLDNQYFNLKTLFWLMDRTSILEKGMSDLVTSIENIFSKKYFNVEIAKQLLNYLEPRVMYGWSSALLPRDYLKMFIWNGNGCIGVLDFIVEYILLHLYRKKQSTVKISIAKIIDLAVRNKNNTNEYILHLLDVIPVDMIQNVEPVSNEDPPIFTFSEFLKDEKRFDNEFIKKFLSRERAPIPEPLILPITLLDNKERISILMANSKRFFSFPSHVVESCPIIKKYNSHRNFWDRSHFHYYSEKDKLTISTFLKCLKAIQMKTPRMKIPKPLIDITFSFLFSVERGPVNSIVFEKK